MFKILKKEETGAFILLNQNCPDMIDYLGQGFAPVFDEAKTKNACIEWLKDYWSENYVPEELQIFASVN